MCLSQQHSCFKYEHTVKHVFKGNSDKRTPYDQVMSAQHGVLSAIFPHIKELMMKGRNHVVNTP